MKNVFLCSGQGSLKPGVGKTLYDKNPQFKQQFQEISRIMGEDISSYTWGGRRMSLSQNALVSHRVLFALTWSLYQTLKENGKEADLFMGHSLGQLISTILSGSLSLDQGLDFINFRGECFEKNKQEASSEMAAILGPDVSSYLQEMEEITGVYGANFNTPDQIVVSFLMDAFPLLQELADRRKLKLVRLQVGNGCHSPLVGAFDQALKEKIETLNFLPPQIPLWSTQGSGLLDTPEKIKSEWLSHLIAPVYWHRSLVELSHRGNQMSYLDLGFGKVIKGLVMGWNPLASVETGEALLTGQPA